MALQKEGTYQFDVVASYWVITQLNIYWDGTNNKTAHVELAVFRSKTAKDAGEPSLKSYSYDFSGTIPFTKGGNSEAEFYVWLKEQAALEMEKPEEERQEKFSYFNDAVDA